MRKIELKNEKLSNILEERGVIHKAIGEINEKLVALDKERTKLGYKMERLKEKTSPIIDKLTPDFNIGEFEIISRVYLNDNKQPEVEIVDRLEEYEKALREEAKNKAK